METDDATERLPAVVSELTPGIEVTFSVDPDDVAGLAPSSIAVPTRAIRVTTEPADDRVFIALERDESGYPPWDEEEIWAVPRGGGLFELDSSPTFARGLSHRDLVHAVEFEGRWWVDRVEEHRGHSTVRIIAFDDSTHDEIIDLGSRFGCDVDHTELAGLYAIDVPPEGDYAGLVAALAEGHERGWWDFEEGNVDSRHQH